MLRIVLIATVYSSTATPVSCPLIHKSLLLMGNVAIVSEEKSKYKDYDVYAENSKKITNFNDL